MYEKSFIGFEPIKDDVIDEPLSRMVLKLVLTIITLIVFLWSLIYIYHSWMYNRTHAMKSTTLTVTVDSVNDLKSDGNGNYIIPTLDNNELVIPSKDLNIQLSSTTYPYITKYEPSGECKPIVQCPEKPVNYVLYLTGLPE